MKKILFMILVIIIAISLPPVFAEEEEPVFDLLPPPETEADPQPAGEWYGEIGGLPVTLILRADGTCTFSDGNVLEPDYEGAWRFEDSLVCLDEETEVSFFFQEGRLSCEALGLVLTREPADVYAAGAVSAQAREISFGGAWMSRYRLVNGAALPVSQVEDDTRIYIEQTRAALTGPLFGEQIVDLAFENGAMTYAGEGIAVRMEMQEDDLLRMTVEKAGEKTVLILAGYTVDALDNSKEYLNLMKFVGRCYQNALGREGSEDEILLWIDFVLNGEKTPADIARDILGSEEFRNRGLGNEETVKAMYRIYFNREADEGGLSYWTGLLDSGESLETVEAGFAVSEEFQIVLSEME